MNNEFDAKQIDNSEAESEASLSRRKFLWSSAAGLGAAAAGIGSSAFAADSVAGDIPSIRMADAFKASLAETPAPGQFAGPGMTGAEVFANLCQAEELAALFCCPGNYTVINALAAAGVPSYGGVPRVRCARWRTDFRAPPVKSLRLREPKARVSPT